MGSNGQPGRGSTLHTAPSETVSPTDGDSYTSTYILKNGREERDQGQFQQGRARFGKIVEENIKFECIGNFYNGNYMIPGLGSSHFSKSGYFYGILCYKKNDKFFLFLAEILSLSIPL